MFSIFPLLLSLLLTLFLVLLQVDTLSSSFVIDLTINKRSLSYKKFTCLIVDALSLEFYYYKFGGFSAVGNLVCNSARVVDSKRVIWPSFFFFFFFFPGCNP